jgi:hypothetical protein
MTTERLEASVDRYKLVSCGGFYDPNFYSLKVWPFVKNLTIDGNPPEQGFMAFFKIANLAIFGIGLEIE